MKILDRLPTLLAVGLCLGIISWSCSTIFYRTYFQTPREDVDFLNRVFAKSEIMKRFDRVGEELPAGDRFEMTGWYPLPSRKVTGTAFSVIRRNGWKIYFFFDSAGMLEEYFITSS